MYYILNTSSRGEWLDTRFVRKISKVGRIQVGEYLRVTNLLALRLEYRALGTIVVRKHARNTWKRDGEREGKRGNLENDPLDNKWTYIVAHLFDRYTDRGKKYGRTVQFNLAPRHVERKRVAPHRNSSMNFVARPRREIGYKPHNGKHLCVHTYSTEYSTRALDLPLMNRNRLTLTPFHRSRLIFQFDRSLIIMDGSNLENIFLRLDVWRRLCRYCRMREMK